MTEDWEDQPPDFGTDIKISFDLEDSHGDFGTAENKEDHSLDFGTEIMMYFDFEKYCGRDWNLPSLGDIAGI